MRLARLLVPLLALLLIVPSTPQSDVKKSFNFFLGGKKIDDFSDNHTGGDLDKQGDIGIEMSFGGYDWPVMLAVDLLASGADDDFSYYYYNSALLYGYINDADVKASSAEIDFGIRKTWEFANNPTRPYIGGGLSAIHGSFDIDVDTPFGSFHEEDSGWGTGYWIGGGVYWKIGEKFNIGLNIRHSSAEVDFDDFGVNNVDVGGTHGGLVLGWGF
jgi:opacity protein-like surface antigen